MLQNIKYWKANGLKAGTGSGHFVIIGRWNVKHSFSQVFMLLNFSYLHTFSISLIPTESLLQIMHTIQSDYYCVV